MNYNKLLLEKNITESEVLCQTDGEISAAGFIAQMLDNQIVIMKTLDRLLPEIDLANFCRDCGNKEIEDDTEPCVTCFRKGGARDNWIPLK
jgi:hypothetical protein